MNKQEILDYFAEGSITSVEVLQGEIIVQVGDADFALGTVFGRSYVIVAQDIDLEYQPCPHFLSKEESDYIFELVKNFTENQ